jgi:hypothetical protein
MAMARQLKVLGLALAVSVSTMTFFCEEIAAQNAPPTVSAVTLHTMPGQNGQQMVVTPRGMVVPLPGAGVNSNVVQIYIGSQGGYWYVDRNGQQVDLTEYVARFQGTQRAGQLVQTPQYAPAPVQVNNYESSSGSSSSGSGGSGLGTALAAGAGAFAGAALTNTYDNSAYWHGVPYGTPYHYNSGNPVYVNRGGNTVDVDNNYSANVNRTTNRTNNVNAQQFNTNVTAQQTNVMAQQNNAMAQQQSWYNQHAKDNSKQYQGWQSQRSAGSTNPFVNSDAKYGWANQQASNDGGGRFGRRGGNGGNGGNVATPTQQGGRFGGGGGGRFGDAEGGGRFGGGGRRRGGR